MYKSWSPLSVLSYILCFRLFILKKPSYITMLSYKHHYDRKLGPDISWPVREIDCLCTIFIYSPPPWATPVCLWHVPTSPPHQPRLSAASLSSPVGPGVSRSSAWSESAHAWLSGADPSSLHMQRKHKHHKNISSRDKNLVLFSYIYFFIFIILIRAS